MENLTMTTVFHEINLRDFGDIEEENGACVDFDDDSGDAEERITEHSSSEEWDTDLEDEGYRPVRRDFNDSEAVRRLYLAACRQLNIVPANCFIKGMHNHTINLNFQGLGPLGIKAVATALVMDKTSTSLLLAGNFMGRDGVRYICEMLKENFYLTHLDLSENDLDSYGAVEIAEIFRENDTLTSLNLSGNKFKGQDAEHIANILAMPLHNRSTRSSGVRVLDMSHNEFGDTGANIIGHVLGDNETLVHLSLAWNQIRKPGIQCLSKGLSENTCLKTLDLSNNGVDNDAAELLAKALTQNSVLEELNLNSNRVGIVGITSLFTALGKNDCLKKLRLTNNPITRHGPLTALTVLHESENTTLLEFEIADACVPREFNALLEEVQVTRPEFKVNCGGFMNSRDMIKAENKFSQDNWMKDPVLVFINFVEERKYKILDMFKNFDKDKSCTLSPAEFKGGLTQVGCALNDSQLNELIRALDIDRSGEIDIEEFLDGFDKHKRRLQRFLAGSRAGSRASSANSKRGSSRPSSSRFAPSVSQTGSTKSGACADDKENTDTSSRDSGSHVSTETFKQSIDQVNLLQPPNMMSPLRQTNENTGSENDYVLVVPHGKTM